MHCDPGACKGGHEAAPDDVPDRSAAAQVGARRCGSIFDDRDRECERPSEKIENSEEQYHGSQPTRTFYTMAVQFILQRDI